MKNVADIFLEWLLIAVLISVVASLLILITWPG
jgi:hypothetical protein